MKRIILIPLSALYFLLLSSPVFAIDPPIQTSPVNGSTVSDTNMQWQIPSYILYSGSHYRIQVDDDQSFSSTNKDSYPENNSYSPNGLSDGTWYWRVKAKDSTGNWSDWSSIWSYILSSVTPTPTDSSTPTTTPTPTPNNSPNISISNVPSSINVDQSFDASVQITNFSPNSNYYLKGAFKKSDTSNYFGQTLVGNTWIKNNEEYTKQLLITTDSSGNWNGTISIKGDQNDSGFTGNDNYVFKVGYYHDGSSVSWSNEVIVNLTGSVPTPTQTPTPTTKSTVTPTKLPTTKPTLTPTKNSQELALNTDVNLPQSILGITVTPSVSSSPASTKTGTSAFSFKNLLFISGGIILILLGGLALTFVVKNRFKKI